MFRKMLSREIWKAYSKKDTERHQNRKTARDSVIPSPLPSKPAFSSLGLKQKEEYVVIFS